MQCLGLQMFLASQGYKAEIIDYSSNGYTELRRTNIVKSLVLRINRFLDHPVHFLKVKLNAKHISREKDKEALSKRNIKFEAFRNRHYVLSQNKYLVYSDLRNSPPKYDVYICGSDQIWNPFFCDMDDSYFLSFSDKDKRMAYAPSFGVSSLPAYAKKEYTRRLKTFRLLSIREKTGALIINKLIHEDVPVVIDPTFLIDSTQWNEIANESDLGIKGEYILTYFIGIDSYIEKYIKNLKRSMPSYKIINLVFDKTEYGPADFLKLIRDAKFVFTNSFHGLAFCINFQVPFAVGKTLKDYGAGSAFSRIEDILNQLGLQNRIVDLEKEIDTSWLDFSFDDAFEKLNILVDYSKKYLIDGINIIVNE